MITFDTLAARVDAQMNDSRRRLETLVRIPSVSSLPAREADMERSARKVAAYFAELGLDSRVVTLETAEGLRSRPAILASRPAAPGKPTVLLYAHHDVQPATPDGWNSEPFEPVERNGRLYGRGTADDKAGVTVHMGALQALASETGVGIKVFVEGEEEVGSPTFRAFLERHREELEADVIVVADSSNWKCGIPGLTVTLRGVATLKVRIDALEHGVHSGEFGGPVLDAATLMARLVATLHGEDGSVAVAGLDAFDESGLEYPEADFRKDSSAVDGLRLAGTGSLASRLWTKPAIDVIGMDVTSCAEASNTIIPRCTALLSLRVTPGQDPREAAEALKAHLLARTPFGARLDVEIEEAGPSFRADTSSPASELMREALEEAYGHPAVDLGVGGSIPFISDLKEAFPEADVLVTGVSDPDARLHAANESLYLADWRNAILAEALLIAKLDEHA